MTIFVHYYQYHHYHYNHHIDRDLSAHLPFGSYAEQAMHTKAPSRFTIVILIIAHNFTINKILYFMTRLYWTPTNYDV